jgi:serine/threonine protein kinase/formylglycine-generating enzyme required for sulfatase activity/dienelactone hydrolase
MKQELWRRAEDLFHAALERSPEARRAFLDEACGEDAELRRQVEMLVSKDEHAGSFLEKPLLADVTAPLGASGSLVDRQLGPYRILSLLDEGGMGKVYRAHDGKLGRDVAIKTLPAEFVHDRERLVRFRREARTLASLNHPNIEAIYELEESPEVDYLVLELVEGERLHGPLPLDTALDRAGQVAEALQAAHEHGIIHRDLKPANVKVTPQGRVKLLDFGLAKAILGTEAKPDLSPSAMAAGPASVAGHIVGTPGYMSPEQARGAAVDQRTDIWAFGCLLFELLAGKRAFAGETVSDTIAAVLEHEPDWQALPARTPAKVRNLMRQCLRKDPANRYGSAAEVIQELKELEISLAPPVRLSRNAWIAVGAAVVLTGILAGWLWRASSRERWALQTATPEITRLIDAGEYVKAAALTREARAALPKDPTLEKLWVRATGEVSITSIPSDAVVSIRPYRGDPNAWETLGKTPLQKVRLPREAYVWRLVKPGFASVFFIAEPLGQPPPGFPSYPNINMTYLTAPNINMALKLLPAGSVPHEMVVVPGGRIGLGYPLSQAPAAAVDDFLIDRHEVTNEEYKKFVDAGGYQKREFWKQPFAKDGRTVPWEDAVAFFHDATGRPGPATWEAGDYPKGHEKYPVAGVSWYEAAAYAEFAGKSLPTAYHWTRASQAPAYTPLIASGSNFGRDGTWPVGSEGALSGFGTTDMAGNVKEWCLNEARDARRLILGGSFGEPNYMFNHTDAQSPWERRANFGFRCVKLDSPPTTAAAAHIEVTIRDYRKEKPVAEDVFKVYKALYAYDKEDLNAKVEEAASTEGSSREKVTFDAAYGNERVTAYLFLPKNASPPFQVVVYFPGAFAFMGDKLDLSSVEETRGFLLQSGRALIFPMYKGAYERRDGFVPGAGPPAAHRDHVIAWAKDLSRSLDYLETRKDIDCARVAYFGDSLGGIQGALQPAVEKRIKAAILSSGGLTLTAHPPPEADPLNFVTRVTIPVLVLSGRYDATFPLESSQRPLYQFLGTPGNNKKHVIYEGGHGAFPRPDAVRECLDWLDRYLGPVRR